MGLSSHLSGEMRSVAPWILLELLQKQPDGKQKVIIC